VNSYKNAPRILGAAFLFVIVASILSGMLLDSATGSGSISDMLVHISNNITSMRIAILSGMVNSTGVVILAVLLYIVLREQNRNLALIALGLWLAEAIFYAIIQVGSFALIPLSLDFVASGAPVHSFYQTLGEFLYNGIYTQGMTIHMWFYCLGGSLWYYLLYRSRYVPRIIPLFGLAAVSLALVGIVFQLFGYTVPFLVFLPILPFELAIGVWLLFKGIKEQPPAISPGPQMTAGG
jgi:hypothetical protein